MTSEFEFVCAQFNIDNITDETLAHILHPEEQEKIKKAIEKRKAEFAAGRFCAKKAFLNLSGDSTPLSAFPLYNDSFGAPFFADGKYFVSLAHDASLAAAVVSNKKALKVGIDLEEQNEKNSNVIFKYINDNEKKLIRENSQNFSFDFLCTAVWVAKESMSKLLGLGFSAFPALEIPGFENGENFLVTFKNFGGFKAVIRTYQNHVFGFCAHEKEIENFYKSNLEIILQKM